MAANKQANKCIVEAHSGSPHYVLQDHVHDVHYYRMTYVDTACSLS